MESQQEQNSEPTVSEQLIDLHMLASEQPLHASPTYSESLSRIQNGYLHCISILEAQIGALQDSNKEARAKPIEMRGQIVQLQNMLAVKTKALGDSHWKIAELEGLVKQLSQALEAAKRENMSTAKDGADGGFGEGSRKMSSVQGKRKWGNSGTGTADDPWSL
ncbi:uncharacterized protein K460DRAFT_44343 [Cucurbitaria berberidis CBS 394.84]|uniref:Uncharacterized protein n=1 Tax=Cucurbitaria berberidis CBS 394.84 TaxID=1168544 RepID=A0A9P4GV98_9PLEO|nr:uncharacterized protein K460DRAFT_44343 [Cucurbitaria berberidis CBS 394.84]KAF1851952.1 hypothetical protein K460DRAFT_44343 [Cucurbitaria berberidis CBS 394.84]